jgi:transglutaminase-like putative cysteine protease
MSVRFASYPTGFAGTRFTIDKMRQLARNGKVDPVVIKTARLIVRNSPEKDYETEAEAIYNYVRRNVRYTRDPQAVELVQSPRVTLREGHGDCDDIAILIAALAEAVGMQAAFLAVKADRRVPNEFSHVLAIIHTQEGWRGADTTVAEGYLGWVPPEALDPSKRRIWSV